MIDGKSPPTLSPTVPTMGGQESGDIGVASGGGGSLVSGGTGGGTAKMSVVPRNPPAAVPTSGDTPSRKPVRLCQVCGDIAKSLHFGGLSCDSCKAFFRRSVQNDAYKHFRCGGDQKCAISIASRKFCKYCRFAKCESIGMTKSWVMSEDERLQLMKTRLTKRMMYQQGGTGNVAGSGSGGARSESGSGGSGGGGSGGGGGGRGSSSGSYSPNECSKDTSAYPNSSSSKNLSSRYQNSSSASLAYHSPTQPADLGSTGSSPNSSPSTPVSAPLTPIQYGPIPPPTTHHSSESVQRHHISPKQESPVRSLCRGIKRESEEEEVMPVDRVFNPASQYLDTNEVEILTRVISNIKLVDQQLPYNLNKPTEVMSTYKRFAERVTRFLRQFPEFTSLSQQTQGLAIKKNITVIALVFGSSFVNEETGSYHNLHSPTRPMVTNLDMIQKSQSPEVFNKFREILGSLRQFNIDSRMAYLLVLIIVLGCEGQESNRDIYKKILQHYTYWKFGDSSGKSLYEGLMSSLHGLRRHSELFESMALRQKPGMSNTNHSQHASESASSLAMDVKSKVEALTGDQIRQMLNGMDIEQMKQMLQGNGLEQMKQMLQSMESETSQSQLTHESHSLIHSPPLPCHSPHSMVQSPHSMVQSPHSMLPSPHSMLQSPQGMLSPQSMMEASHSMIQPSSSPGMLQSPNLSQSIHTMLDISHSMSHSPNSTVTQIINSSNNLLNHYQDMKPPGAFMNSPQPLDMAQSPIEISSPSPHAMNLAPSPTPYIPNQETYLLDQQISETPYPDHRQSPLDDSGYLNPPLYPQPPYSPAPLSDHYNSGFQALFSPLPYKEENLSVSNSSTGSSGVGVSLTSSLTSPISSLLTSPAPSHSSLHESDNSLSNYHEPEHGNSLGAAP
ncbi:hypothetical protein OTU49_005728 [Cherax quadricarinatus]|uniref:Nuclear receptor domain-containing protein n=1 Tax=Cherax quadricarinatus TaxID=27406 RepID=A0AAW0X3M3_CHEQU